MAEGSAGKERAEVDDHDVSALGKGYTMGIMTGQLTISESHLRQLPRELRFGLFAQPKTYPAVIRVSHTVANNIDLLRVAVKINTAENPAAEEDWTAVMDMLTTESGNVFPLEDFHHLRSFMYMTDNTISPLQKVGDLWKRSRVLYGGYGSCYFWGVQGESCCCLLGGKVHL